MRQPVDLQERLVRLTGLWVLAAGSLAAAVAFWLHLHQARHRAFDLGMSGALALAFLALLVYLWMRRGPLAVERATWIGFVLALVGLALPAWYYSFAAWQDPSLPLVENFPPISAALLPLILALIVLLRPRRPFAIAVVSWLLVAAPLLAYLLAHPAELMTPRGREMLVTLGPVALVFMAYIPFQRGIDRWVGLLQKERARMQALAERDGLTGLYNRRAGENLLSKLVASPERSDALVIFDIDHFKRINDTLGHPVGDEVLRQVARRCEALLRQEDVFARWGGEEFLVLVCGTREDGAANAAEHLRTAVCGTPIEPVGTVSASFGVARFRPSDTVGSWVARADSALYAAKSGGRNRVATD
jgi:diguanylate cyclase (GGDEF)-like protein